MGDPLGLVFAALGLVSGVLGLKGSDSNNVAAYSYLFQAQRTCDHPGRTATRQRCGGGCVPAAAGFGACESDRSHRAVTNQSAAARLVPNVCQLRSYFLTIVASPVSPYINQAFQTPLHQYSNAQHALDPIVHVLLGDAGDFVSGTT